MYIHSSIAATQKRDTDLLIPLAERFNLSFTAFGSLISEADVPAYGTLTLTGGGIDPAPVSPIDAEPFKVLSGSIRAAYNTHRGIKDAGPEDGLIVSPGITTGNTGASKVFLRHVVLEREGKLADGKQRYKVLLGFDEAYLPLCAYV